MKVSDIVAEGVAAHEGGSYFKAISCFLMALLMANKVPGDRFDGVGGGTTTEGAGAPKDPIGPWQKIGVVSVEVGAKSA